MTGEREPRRVVVTRPTGRGAQLARELEQHGITVHTLPLLEYTPPADDGPLVAAASRDDYDVWVFTSVEAVARTLEHRHLPFPTPPPRILAVGSATRQALRERGVSRVEQPQSARAEGILQVLVGTLGGPSRILFPRAADARTVLTSGLRSAGHVVNDPIAYDKGLPDDAAERFRSLFGEGPFGWVTFTSPRIVRHFVELAKDDWNRRRSSLLAASIGPVTSAALEEVGTPRIAEAASPSDEALARCILDARVRTC